MAEIVNLKNARKARARAEAEKVAAANRQRFGRTREEKAATQAELERQARQLDNAQREDR